MDRPMRPRLLDLFARAQGSSVGYARAGFDVTALDIDEYPRHPEVSAFIQADAREALADTSFMQQFDVVTGSPKCQGYSTLRTASARAGKIHEQQIDWVREGMIRSGLPYVIENVEGAQWAMRDPITLCGSMFGLGADCRDGNYRQLRRHRLFESNAVLFPKGECQHYKLTGGVYGTGGGGPQTRGYRFHWTIGVYGKTGNGPASRGYSGNLPEASQAMGIDWMSRADLSQAIPPVYTQWLGANLMYEITK
jgi:DNA (cytosine-5)-methyltransferase 1